MKPNKCIALLSTSILCVSLLTFGTYSIYSLTNNNKANLKIDSMDLKTSLTDLNTYYNGVIQTENNFHNGGSWSLDNGTLSINNMNKYDSFSFNIHIKNTRSFPCVFKIYNDILDDFSFFENFNVEYVNNWVKINGNEEINLPFKVECISNINKNSSSKINFGIEAYQFTNDSNLKDLDIKNLSLNSNIIKNIDNINNDIEISTENNAFKVNIPKSKLAINTDVSLKVSNLNTNTFEVDENSSCLIYNLELNGINDNEELLTSSLYIGRNLSNIKLHELIEGTDTINESMKYDKNTGYLTFESKNLSDICVEILKEEYFTPLSSSAKENALNLKEKIDNLDNATLKINSGSGDFDFSEIETPLDLNNKNISIVGLEGSNLNTKFNMNNPFVISGESNINFDNITINTNNSILKAMDKSIVNLYDVNFIADNKDLSIIESVKTDLGEPFINIYDGNYKAFEFANAETTNPLLKTSNTINSTDNGNIYVYGGKFENFNPGEVYYQKNNEAAYNSFLAEGTYCRNNNANDKTFEVKKLIKDANILNNAYKELYDVEIESFRRIKIIFKYNLWLSPYLAKNNEENMYCFYGIPLDGRCNTTFTPIYDFNEYRFNYAMNEKMLNTIKEQQTKYFMFKEEIKNGSFYIVSSVDTHKQCINPTISTFDGSTNLFNGYGFDLYKSEYANKKTKAYLGSGVYNNINIIRLNNSIKLAPQMEIDFYPPYRFYVYATKEFTNHYFSYDENILEEKSDWDPNYYGLRGDPYGWY